MMTLAQIKKFELWPQPICSVVHKTFYTTISWFSIIDHTNGDDYASPLLGILVMQDVHLGFLIAILPALAGHHGTRSARVIKSGLVHDLFHGIRHSGSWMDELFFVTTQNIYVLCMFLSDEAFLYFVFHISIYFWTPSTQHTTFISLRACNAFDSFFLLLLFRGDIACWLAYIWINSGLTWDSCIWLSYIETLFG